MSKYIDADLLVRKIKGQIRKENLNFAALGGGGQTICTNTLEWVLKQITSLQQEQSQVADASKMEPEVDLEKEYKEYVEDDPVFSKLTNRNVGLAIARHFWNKGYNARNKK